MCKDYGRKRAGADRQGYLAGADGGGFNAVIKTSLDGSMRKDICGDC